MNARITALFGRQYVS